MTHIVAMQYTKSFKLHRGGKAANPQELTLVSDWGVQPQPTKRQLRG
ncbi:addiction module toxin RelE [Salmonella enterica subsp. enterica serovar Gloucester]|nr:addiction module toxin RelE [Salmonella enterica subsp. enterica serovar Gloucester]